jgi:hypothetical protein
MSPQDKINERQRSRAQGGHRQLPRLDVGCLRFCLQRVRHYGTDARYRRLSDADLRAGCLGCHSGTSERAVAAGHSCNVPGVVYQLGNLLASYNATLQAGIGKWMDPNYSWALARVAGVVAVVIAVLVGFGVEARDVKMGEDVVSEAP